MSARPRGSFGLLIFSILLISSGCHAPAPEPIKMIVLPEIGTTFTAGVGEPLLRSFYGQSISRPGIIIPKDQIIEGLVIPKGEYPEVGRNEKFIRYVTDHLQSTSGNIQRRAWIYLYLANNSICIRAGHCAPLEYKLGTVITSTYTKTGFQQTLLYSGKIGNRITLGYREFSNDLARPAFNNDVSYDLSESMVLGYKGARLEVIRATNSEITYKVISGFN